MKMEAFAVLDAVLRHGTLAAAAREANVTPSAVSMQMKQLETYLGQQLFDRSGLRVKPLRVAYEVSEAMKPALARLNSLRLQSAVMVEGNIGFGVIESLQPMLLPGVMRYLADRYPLLRVLPSRGKSADLTDAVKSGDSDAAVVAQPEAGGASRLTWHPLFRRELVLITPPQSQETSLNALFRQYEWIRYDRKTETGRLAAHYVGKHIRKARSSIELDGVRAIVAMVSAGVGISVVQIADPGIQLMYPVRTLRLPNAPQLQFSLVTRRTDSESRKVAAVKEALHALLQDNWEDDAEHFECVK